MGKPPQMNLTYKIQKKEEFPGFMVYMLSGNSFPQIFVVSVNKSVKKSMRCMVKIARKLTFILSLYISIR